MTTLPFAVTKQTVTAATRQLSAKWAIEPQSHYGNFYQPLTLKSIIKKWYVGNHGVKVPLYTREAWNQGHQWCHDYAQGAWICNMSNVIMDDQQFCQTLRERWAQGHLDGQSVDAEDHAERQYNAAVEQEIMDALALEISNQIDGEILSALDVRQEKPAFGYYWFLDAQDAILFKLTWGGE